MFNGHWHGTFIILLDDREIRFTVPVWVPIALIAAITLGVERLIIAMMS